MAHLHTTAASALIVGAAVAAWRMIRCEHRVADLGDALREHEQALRLMHTDRIPKQQRRLAVVDGSSGQRRNHAN